MNATVRHLYRYCGLTIDSTLALPELPDMPVGGNADVTIRHAAVPAELPDAARQATTFQANGTEALYVLEDIARYRVRHGGTLIEVEAAARSDPTAVRLFLLHPVFALAALLRGDFLLAAAAVAEEGRVTAFVGESASGKSTLAATLAVRGHAVVSDSLLRLSITPEGGVLAHPQAPWLLLWPDSVRRLGLGGTRQRTRKGLLLQRCALPAADAPLPLARIAVLQQQQTKGSTASVSRERPGLAGLELVTRNTAGFPWLNDFPAVRKALFLWATRVAGAALIERLHVPWDESPGDGTPT